MNGFSGDSRLKAMSESGVISDIPGPNGLKWLDDSVGPYARVARDVKAAAAADLRECKHSREQVAEMLSDAMGRRITLAQIDAVVAETKEHRFPAEWIPAWTVITGSRRILDLLCGRVGCSVADADERKWAELGREGLRAKKAQQRADQLERELWDKLS